jgi:predicted transcriptional regulator of viral defense system
MAVPRGIICLLSALSFHELTTQLPFEVWMAVNRRAASPRVDAVPLRLVRFSGAALHVGIEEHQIEGVAVRVTSLVRTVVDCFRYRNKYGVDIAVEALRDAVYERRATVGQVAECAAQLRMRNVMRPYLDMLVY